MKRITDYLSTLGLVLIMPAWLLYYLKIEPRLSAREEDLLELEAKMRAFGVDPAPVVLALRAQLVVDEHKRRELSEHIFSPFGRGLMLGTLIVIALFAAGLSLLSRGRVPLFVGLPSGYVAAAALLAGLYETWKDVEL